MRWHHAEIPRHPCRPRHPHVRRGDAAHLRADPAGAGRPHRASGRRTRDRSRPSRHAARRVGAGSAVAQPVRHLHHRRAFGRSRQVDRHQDAGDRRVLRPVSGHRRALDLRHSVGDDAGHSDRHSRRGPARIVFGLRHHGGLAHRLFDADLLVGAASDPVFFGAPGMDAGFRTAVGDVLRRAGDRLHADRHPALRREGCVRIRRPPSDPAGDRARHHPAGDHRPNDPLVDARGARRGLHPDRPGQGAAAAAGHRLARLAQRADPGGHGDRPRRRRPVRRRHPHRDHLLVAGRRQVAGRVGAPA